MGQVVVTVNGHPYTMQCHDGEEDHLNELAQLLDSEVQQIRTSVGHVGDIRLLLMAGLIIADRLSDSLKKIEELQEQISGIRQDRGELASAGRDLEDQVSERLIAAAARLEELARSERADDAASSD
jgi:cell division protein ZapA